MLQYMIRRLLLAIPTFFGCTIVVFSIVQLAPGGPLEQQIQALKSGAAAAGGGEGGGSTGLGAEGVNIPPQALAELRRYYEFDRPLHMRYLSWLGLVPRETESYNVVLDEPRNIGAGRSVIVSKEGNQYKITDVDTREVVSDWKVENSKIDTATYQLRVYKTAFAGILTGYFGKSHVYGEPVLDIIAQRIPISIQFGLIGMVISYVVCINLGIQKALRHSSTFDVVTSSLVLMSYSIPGWVIGLLLLVLFGGGSFWDVFPLGGFQSGDYNDLSFGEKILDRAHHFVLPTVAWVFQSFATITLLMKNSLLENLSQDYVRTAFAKGLKERRVVWMHALRNSIIPVSANLGHLITIFLAGSLFVERVFNIQGIGWLSFEAVLARDYPIVFAFTVITVAGTLVGAIISDFILASVDPRIRFK